MNFERVDRTLFWEMGYWKDTLDRWYQEGFPKNNIVTIGLKSGEGIKGENASHEEFFLDRKRDVEFHDYFGFDKGMIFLPFQRSFLSFKYKGRVK